MAAERVVKTEDGEKLAKVMYAGATRPSSQRRAHPPAFSDGFSIAGIRRSFHGDQRKDGGQRGAGLPRHSQVSLEAAPVVILHRQGRKAKGVAENHQLTLQRDRTFL